MNQDEEFQELRTSQQQSSANGLKGLSDLVLNRPTMASTFRREVLNIYKFIIRLFHDNFDFVAFCFLFECDVKEMNIPNLSLFTLPSPFIQFAILPFSSNAFSPSI